jgi:alkylation response protein AidB-like acyl-CoA dehydrogenase
VDLALTPAQEALRVKARRFVAEVLQPHEGKLGVDRIWEDTSDIQRLIIARSLERQGVDRVVG